MNLLPDKPSELRYCSACHRRYRLGLDGRTIREHFASPFDLMTSAKCPGSFKEPGNGHIVHLVPAEPGSVMTLCCNADVRHLPAWHRYNTDPGKATCKGASSAKPS